MKEIKGYVGKVTEYGSVWTCRIKDEEAMRECLLGEMSGWSAKDAVKKFNERLKWFGFVIAEIEHDALRY